MAHWIIQKEHGGFPIERAVVGSFDLSVLYVGPRAMRGGAAPSRSPGIFEQGNFPVL